MEPEDLRLLGVDDLVLLAVLGTYLLVEDDQLGSEEAGRPVPHLVAFDPNEMLTR
jgi:hypothetical protein